ncbi:MAG: hypothetical protein HFI59_16190 [Lachnospiraceae bacterium]|nr:hypothetical protein [Lachnospiraceae bacterium]
MAAHGKSVCRLQGKATCGTRFRKNVSGPGKSRIRKKKNQEREESEKEESEKKNQERKESGKRKIGKRNGYETEDQGYSGGNGLFSV